MGFLSSRSFPSAAGLACRVGADTSEFGSFFLRPAVISMIMVKIVNTRRKPEARFCFDTSSWIRL